jgi:hypothetical protein
MTTMMTIRRRLPRRRDARGAVSRAFGRISGARHSTRSARPCQRPGVVLAMRWDDEEKEGRWHEKNREYRIRKTDVRDTA